jgi:ectoine hydroxylase-related dioxygenase (phytanoyl-CoA dioxygenase family)
MVLTREQKEQFEREGYLIFDPELDANTFDLIIEDLADKYNDKGPPIDVAYRDNNRIQDAWRINPHVKAIARAPKTLAILEELYGRQPLPFQTLNFPKGTEQPPHADAIHFNSMPATFMCGVWVALEDIDMENGPLVYYPGSQKYPEVTIADLMPKEKSAIGRLAANLLRRPAPDVDAARVYPLYQQYVAQLIEREKLEPRFATVKEGQALVWSSNILHGGSFQKDKTRSRHSQVTHYFFAGCKYYTPLLSRGKQIVWRNPDWIV